MQLPVQQGYRTFIFLCDYAFNCQRTRLCSSGKALFNRRVRRDFAEGRREPQRVRSSWISFGMGEDYSQLQLYISPDVPQIIDKFLADLLAIRAD